RAQAERPAQFDAASRLARSTTKAKKPARYLSKENPLARLPSTHRPPRMVVSAAREMGRASSQRTRSHRAEAIRPRKARRNLCRANPDVDRTTGRQSSRLRSQFVGRPFAQVRRLLKSRYNFRRKVRPLFARP